MTKTLPNIANPHIRIYREIGQQVLASIEDGWTDGRTDGHTHRQTDVIELYIRLGRKLILLFATVAFRAYYVKTRLSENVTFLEFKERRRTMLTFYRRCRRLL